MNLISIKTLLFILPVYIFTSSIYDIDFTTLEGNRKTMNEWRNRKLMIVVLPVTKTSDDSVFLWKLDSLSKSNARPVTVIAVPSMEDGFSNVTKASLLQWYRKVLGSQVIITEGMNTKKKSANQHNLFKWLTHKEENGHFDNDVLNARQRFFISSQGEIYGVISPEIPLDGKVMNLLLQ